MREQDFSNPLFHSIKQTGCLKNLLPMKMLLLKGVIQRGDTKGLPLSADAAKLLIDIVGSDLMDLDMNWKSSVYFCQEQKLQKK
ncbi:MAG: hypothetical protein Ct9H300mP28_36610 [Pseudomonadota bacterium]|nr:MAG: hypothetical protein Ct9H300mP28_36610 [Pseudomonadota bacterium]